MRLYDHEERPIFCQECAENRYWQLDEDVGLYICLHGRLPAMRQRVGAVVPELVRRQVEDAPAEFFEEAPSTTPG